MSLPKNKNLTKIAQALRRNMTKEERHLWYDYLKNSPIQFNRQKVIGSYIVDFYCDKAKLIVELDGSQHYDEDQIALDEKRTSYLKSLDLKIMRIPNNEIWEDFESVCKAIDDAVNRRTDPYHRV